MPYEAGDRHYVNVQDIVASVMYQLRGFLAPDGVVHFEIPIKSWEVAREISGRYPIEQVVRPCLAEYSSNTQNQKTISFDVSRRQADRFLKESASDVFCWSNLDEN